MAKELETSCYFFFCTRVCSVNKDQHFEEQLLLLWKQCRTKVSTLNVFHANNECAFLEWLIVMYFGQEI